VQLTMPVIYPFFACFFIVIVFTWNPGGSIMPTGTGTLARPDLAAHRHATQAPFAKIVEELAEILGKKLTAYVGGVKDTRVVERWIQGGTEPYKDADLRIRLGYQIAKTLSEHDSARVVQAWFTGLNPELQDRTPIRLLKEEDIEKTGPELLNAMRAFLAGG
jgi:hypothetical protein